jgi:hypothetical protein
MHATKVSVKIVITPKSRSEEKHETPDEKHEFSSHFANFSRLASQFSRPKMPDRRKNIFLSSRGISLSSSADFDRDVAKKDSRSIPKTEKKKKKSKIRNRKEIFHSKIFQNVEKCGLQRAQSKNYYRRDKIYCPFG